VTPAARAALYIVLVAAAGPTGFLLYRAVFAGRLPPPAASQPAPQSSAASAAAQSTASQPSGPDQLPALTLQDAGGTAHAFSEWRGRPLIVNFWATWCEPCRREIPLLKSLRTRTASAPVQVVGIAVDFKDPVVKYVTDHGIDYPVMVGEDQGFKAIKALGMDTVLPFSVFADGKGRIVTVKVGELHPDEADLILARVADVESGRMTLALAREQISAGLKELAVARAKGSG